jgi:hypothetical protein
LKFQINSPRRTFLEQKADTKKADNLNNLVNDSGKFLTTQKTA